MIKNLFSIFDPSSSTINTIWLTTLIPLFILFYSKNKFTSKFIILLKLPTIKILIEIILLTKNTIKKGNNIFLTSLFTLIVIINFSALFPFIFTPTAHISVSFSLALLMWFFIILYGWTSNPTNIIIHIVPTGTPIALINFIVIIEIIRNIIRPITLSVRLTANIVAGHLLLSLLRNFLMNNPPLIIISSIIILILTMLEIAVSLIQAYVFSTLITLYHNEIL